MQFLEPARHFHRPTVVPEVPPDLPHDGGHREGDEVRPGVDVVADDGIDQSDPRHLHQIVAGFAASVEAAGDMVGEREAPFHDPIAMTPELRRIGFQFGQFPEHVGNIGIFGVGPRGRGPLCNRGRGPRCAGGRGPLCNRGRGPR